MNELNMAAAIQLTVAAIQLTVAAILLPGATECVTKTSSPEQIPLWRAGILLGQRERLLHAPGTCSWRLRGAGDYMHTMTAI